MGDGAELVDIMARSQYDRRVGPASVTGGLGDMKRGVYIRGLSVVVHSLSNCHLGPRAEGGPRLLHRQLLGRSEHGLGKKYQDLRSAQVEDYVAFRP